MKKLSEVVNKNFTVNFTSLVPSHSYEKVEMYDYCS